MEIMIEILQEEFEALSLWAYEAAKHGEPLCEKDFTERFEKIRNIVKKNTGMDCNVEVLSCLYLAALKVGIRMSPIQ